MTVGSRIPTASRQAVRKRDHDRCARCSMPGTDWHHRRSKSVRDGLTHSPCNGVWMCRSCHSWTHHNPAEARVSGWIVSRYDDPREVPVVHALWGRVTLTEGGEWRLCA